MRVKCLAQEHNAMSPARARTQNARSGVECTNHEATAYAPGKLTCSEDNFAWLVKHYRGKVFVIKKVEFIKFCVLVINSWPPAEKASEKF